MVALALMVSCMPSAYTISASEAFGDGTEDIFTDGEITSEPAAEESTPDVSSADQEETEQAQQSTLTYENDSVKVTAEALEDGALPQNTALKADSVNENSSVSYDTVSQKLSAAATDKGSSLRGFFAYDVYFADGDGNRVEPNGRVRVTFEYKTPAAPELTDAASTSVTVEKLHYNNSTGDTDVNTLQANEDLKVLNVNEGKQIQTLQVETGNAAVFAVMWDSPETADVEAEAVSGNEDEVPIASEELTDGMDISDEPEQDAAETPAAENPEVTPDAEPSEAPAENPDAEPTEAPAENPDVVEEPAEDIASPEDVPAADENGETSLIEVLGDDTNLRVSPSIEAEVLATVNAGTQLTLLDTVTAEDGATWYKVSWEGTEAYIRSDMAQVVDSSDEAEEPEDVQEEEIQPEITRYYYTSGEVNVKVTLTDPADLPDDAKLSVTPVELSQEAEDQITEEAIKEKRAIEKIHSYDIKFLVDGEEVQPGATVKVSVSLNDEKKIKDADVYHVDENDNVENMDGSVAKNGDVEFETTHFSTYVIVQKGKGKVTVTVEHYDNSGSKAVKIYSDDKHTLSVGGSVQDYTKANNWTVEKVLVNNQKISKNEASQIVVASDTNIKVYYKPVETTQSADTTFYDYTVKAGTEKNGTVHSVNDDSNYSGNREYDNRLTVGESGRNYDSYKYEWATSDGKKANSYIGKGKKDPKDAVTGLLKGLDENNQPVFKYEDPGFFNDRDASVTGDWKKIIRSWNWQTGSYSYSESNQIEYGTTRYTRKVYKGYKLQFKQTGDRYELSAVKDDKGEQVATSGAGFFPLDSVSNGYELENSNTEYNSDRKPHNNYFGMRYDVKFKIGDYIGPLNYEFTGDDDMWVVLDGKKVIIDLGGIHDAMTQSVNIWKDLFDVENADNLKLTQGQKETEHTLTVLYMERGAGASNCNMKFTLPNARVAQVSQDPLANFSFTKVNNAGEPLSGARFKLTNTADSSESYNAKSIENGIVSFNDLRTGTYKLEEITAPDGYNISGETWVVKVEKTSDGKSATAVLYKSDGTTPVEKKDDKYNIINYKPEEIIEANMDYNKTATVKNWNERTYDINIKASSTSTSIIPPKKVVADIMLVLDVSGSMGYPVGNSLGKNDSELRRTLEIEKKYYLHLSATNECLTMTYNTSRKEWYVEGKPAYKYERYRWNGQDYYYYVYDSNVTRMEVLKQAVNQFITDTAAKSENSKIGITAFSSNGWGDHGAYEDLKEVGTNKDSLINFVNGLYAEGGTDPYVGLDDAKDKLDAAKNAGDTNPKYVILFTDGQPTGSGSEWDEKAQKNAENSAKALKDAGYTVYTIGFALNNQTKTFLAGGTDNNIKYPGIASPNCAFNASDATELGKIFKDIQGTITQNIDITGATITDVIDPRFVIVKDDGTPISNEDLQNGSIKLKNGGIVSLVKGNQVVTWTDQTIPNKKNTDPNAKKEWNETITVKAKDDYIGGNNVPTNVSPDSRISTGYGDAILPQPTVNVKADLTVDNLEKVIFLGDPTPTTDLPDSMLRSILQKSKNYVYNETTKELEPVRVTKDDLDLTCSWAKDESFGTDKLTNLESMAEDYPTEDPTRYYLKVTYNAGEPTATVGTKLGSTANTGGNIAGGETHIVTAINSDTTNYSNKEYGVYTIHIIKGQIQITKKLEEAAKKEGTFTFNIYKGSAEKANLVTTVTAAVGTGDTDAKFTIGDAKTTTAIVTGLARGEYIVQEVSKSGYQLLNASNDSKVTNCKSEESEDIKDIKFTIGTDNDNKNALEAEALNVGSVDYANYANYAGPGCVGKVDYTNKETVANVDFVKVDAADNNITINGAMFKLYKADESWTKGEEVKAVTSENGGTFGFEKLLPGNYLLNETKAATGYSLVTEPWKIVIKNNGEVTVTKNDGEPVIAKNSDKRYMIENAKVYSLPESGGPGTYGFTISGVAILATALLLFINNKRREEEAKRS